MTEAKANNYIVKRWYNKIKREELGFDNKNFNLFKMIIYSSFCVVLHNEEFFEEKTLNDLETLINY